MKWVKKYDYVITAREFLHLAQPPENKEQKNFIREDLLLSSVVYNWNK